MKTAMHGDQRETDYYAILNLPSGSPEEVIHEQYRRMVKLLHPDRNGGDVWCQEQLKLVNAAYAVLSNIEAKKLYDERRERRRNAPPTFAEQLQEQLADDAPILQERRNLQWSFDTARHPVVRNESAHPQIEFVTRHAIVVCGVAQSTIDDAARDAHMTAVESVPAEAAFRQLLRRCHAVLIVCAAMAILLGAAYIASPEVRSMIRPLLHHDLTSTDMAQRHDMFATPSR